MPQRHGGPCQAPMEDGEGGICGYEGLSSTWYGKRGRQFCGSHRAAWEHDRNDGDAAQGEEDASFVSEMDVLLGSRYCEPTKMSAPQKYNDVKTDALQLCVQGTFTVEGYAKGRTDTRWQTIAELAESCSREDFEQLSAAYIKELQKSFKRDAKRFKTRAQLADE